MILTRPLSKPTTAITSLWSAVWFDQHADHLPKFDERCIPAVSQEGSDDILPRYTGVQQYMEGSSETSGGGARHPTKATSVCQEEQVLICCQEDRLFRPCDQQGRH